MSDGEGLGANQSMNRNPPRNRTPPQTVPLPSSELPQLVPPPSGGVRWMDRSTDNRGVGAPPPPPAPRPPARPPRPRNPSNQRPAASPPDEDFPRLADGRAIQVPTQEIVGQVPQRDVAPERATVGQRGTEPNNQTPTPRNNGIRQDEVLPPMSFNPSQTILEIVQGTNRLIEEEEQRNQERIQRFRGQFINQSIDPFDIQLEFNRWFGSRRTTSPAIESARQQLEAARRHNLLAGGSFREDIRDIRQDIRDARRFLSDLAQDNQMAPYAQNLGILIGIAEEGLEVADGILALPESIAELVSFLPRIPSIFMDFQRLPEDEKVQVLGALAREGANAIFGEIIRLARESLQDAINGHTLDANRKATRAIIKVVGLVTVLKSAIRFLRRSPELFRRISGKIDELGRRSRRLADVGAGEPVRHGITGRSSPSVRQGVSQLSRLRSLISQEEIDEVARILSALESTLSERTRRHITIAVGIFEEGGQRSIGYSITRNRFARPRKERLLHRRARELGVDVIDAEPRVRTRNRTERATHGAPEDAEQLFIEGAETNGWNPIMVMPSRTACPGCAAVAEAEGVFIVARNMASSGL